MRASIAGAIAVAWAGVAVSAPFNPSRMSVVTGTNAFPSSSIAIGVALDGDHLLARNLNNNGLYVLQRHFGGMDKWNVQAKLELAPGVNFTATASLALAGDVAVVGNTSDDTAATDAGAVYVFLRNYPAADAWGYWKTVTEPGASTGDNLGNRVVTDGRYLAVVSGSTNNPVQLFGRNTGGADNWGRIKEFPLTVPLVGSAVDLEGDVLVIGDFMPTTNEQVRIYERNAGGPDNWGLVTTLTPADHPTSNRQFGASVSLAGPWLAVGASQDKEAGGGNEGAVYVFHRDLGGANQWGQMAKRLPDPSQAGELGSSVRVRGDTVVASAPLDPGGRSMFGTVDGGALYVFQRNAGGSNAWGRTAKLLAETNTASLGWETFGEAGLGLGDDIIAATTFGQASAPLGGARVFQEYACPDWTLLKKITPDSPATNGEFGAAVVVDESYLSAGMPGSSPNASNEGGFVTFERNLSGPDAWGQRSLVGGGGVTATNARSGSALALSPQYQVMGSPGRSGYGGIQIRGVIIGGGVTFSKFISAPDLEPGEQFGAAVAVWGDNVLAGAPLNDTAAIGAGAAFIFNRNQGGSNEWGLVRRLDPSPLPATADFGRSAALYRDIAAVGAPYESDLIDGMGAVYVFQANRGGSNNWGQVRRLKVSGIDVPYLGWSVALWGDVLAVGAVGDDSGTPNSGAVYLFERNRGGPDNWGLIKKVKSPTPQDNAEFGWSVALRGDRLVVGEPRRDDDFADQGRVFVFERNQDGTDQWGFVTRIDPPAPQLQAWFGASVALINDRIAVSAPYEDSGTATNAGAVYLFQPDCLRITTTNDVVNAGDGLTSLREAINLANVSTQTTFTVHIPDGVFVSTSTSPHVIANTGCQIILQGQGARRTALDKNGLGRLFQLNPGTTGELRDLTIKNGRAPDGADGMGSTNGGFGGFGGGLLTYGDWNLVRCAIVSNTAGNGGNAQAGQGTTVGSGGKGGGLHAQQGRITIRDCTISHNHAGDAGASGDLGADGGVGGGLSATSVAELRIFNSTIFGNTAGQGSASASDGDGGGVHSFGAVTIRHSTISHNSAGGGANRGSGGGIFMDDPTPLKFSILNNNTGASSAPDAYAVFDDAAYNLISNTNGVTMTGSPVSNIVGVLAMIGGAEVVNNGGPTDTMLPQPGSPVIDKGDATLANLLAKDQRGYLRPTNGISIDLGAVETTTDLDGDGVPDEWELARGTDREEPADAAADLDGDGLTGVQEYIMDANPYGSDPLAVVQIVQTGVTAQLQVPSTTSRVYSLQTTLSLTGGVWSPIPTQQDVPGNGGLLTLVHTNSAPGRGYRVVVELP
jgi:hypothetical protein